MLRQSNSPSTKWDQFARRKGAKEKQRFKCERKFCLCTRKHTYKHQGPSASTLEGLPVRPFHLINTSPLTLHRERPDPSANLIPPLIRLRNPVPASHAFPSFQVHYPRLRLHRRAAHIPTCQWWRNGERHSGMALPRTCERAHASPTGGVDTAKGLFITAERGWCNGHVSRSDGPGSGKLG